MKSTTSDAGRPPDSKPKAVLFCFDCGHESSPDGDWELESLGDCEMYRCPECGTTISVRPDETSTRASSSDSSACYGVGD